MYLNKNKNYNFWLFSVNYWLAREKNPCEQWTCSEEGCKDAVGVWDTTCWSQFSSTNFPRPQFSRLWNRTAMCVPPPIQAVGTQGRTHLKGAPTMRMCFLSAHCGNDKKGQEDTHLLRWMSYKVPLGKLYQSRSCLAMLRPHSILKP